MAVTDLHSDTSYDPRTGLRGPDDWVPSFSRTGSDAATTRLVLTLAISGYDHVRDLLDGRVPVEGVDLIPLNLSIEEIFFRFTKFREWDVSEMSMAKFTSLISQGDRSIIGIPVFPSRVFRHSSIYVRREGAIRQPSDLRGKKVGLPEWAQSAAIYSRGFLVDQFGLKLTDIDWVQAGVNQPGRDEKVALRLPDGVRLERRPDRSLNQMLLDGELDAVLSAHAPQAYKDGHPEIGRMFEDYQGIEEAYWSATGVYPIMHAMVVRSPVLERFPWVAANLVRAFEEAKRRSIARLTEMTASRYPVPWMQDYVARIRDRFGGDPFPYGVEPNRRTLEAFLGYAHQQGVCHRRVEVDELFPKMVSSSFKV